MLYSKFKLAASALFVSITLIILQGVLVQFIPVALAQGTTIYTIFTAQNLDSTNVMNARAVYRNASGASVLTTTHTITPLRNLSISQPSQVGLPTSYTGPAAFEASRSS